MELGQSQRNEQGQFKKGTHWRGRKPFWDKEWLEIEYLEKGRSAADIAADYKVTEGAILHWLNKHGIPRRSISEARQVKHWGLDGAANGMYGRTGDSNPNWKGGITPERQREYSRSEAKAFLKAIRDRDGVCVHCQESERLNVHHIKSFTKNPALRYDPANCVSLCNVCHRWVHSRANVNREYLA